MTISMTTSEGNPGTLSTMVYHTSVSEGPVPVLSLREHSHHSVFEQAWVPLAFSLQRAHMDDQLTLTMN